MLIKSAFGAMRLAHVSLVFAGLMLVLPFLYYHHAYPITTFYQEWGAALLSLCAMPLLVTQRYWQQAEIPRIILLPVGLLLPVLAQAVLGRVAYFDQALLFVLYLLWAALLMMLGYRLREELGLPLLATALAVFLLLGAELSALIGVLQHFFRCAHSDFLDYLKLVNLPGILAGNMAQPNHFADYIALGLFSLGLLHTCGRLRAWQTALLAAPLLFVLTLSGSRSAWLYLLCMVGMAFLWRRRERKDRPPACSSRVLRVLLGLQPLTPEGGENLCEATTAYPMRVDSCQPLLRYSLALFLGFGLMHLAVQIPWLAGCSGGMVSGERLIAEAGSFVKETGGSSIRLYLWREAWLIFTHFPLLGAGFGQFPWQHFQLGPVLRDTNITGLYENAHNLVLQTAAEMGLAGLLLLLGPLASWFWQARKAQRSIYQWWGCGLLAVLAIHSLLEYPLWYAYFLGVAALTLGMLDYTTYRLELRGVGRGAVAAILLFGALIMAQLWWGYRSLEGLAAMQPASASDDGYSRRVRDGLVAFLGERQSLLLRPYAEVLLGEANWNHVADGGILNEHVLRYWPSSAVVYREALLLARAGQQGAACVQIERAIWAYPDDFPKNRDKLRVLAGWGADPARFPALLACALQKYEERQRTIRANP